MSTAPGQRPMHTATTQGPPAVPDPPRPVFVPVPTSQSSVGLAVFYVVALIGLVLGQVSAIERNKELNAKLDQYQQTIEAQIVRAQSRDRLMGAMARKVGMTPTEIRHAWRGVEEDIATDETEGEAVAPEVQP